MPSRRPTLPAGSWSFLFYYYAMCDTKSESDFCIVNGGGGALGWAIRPIRTFFKDSGMRRTKELPFHYSDTLCPSAGRLSKISHLLAAGATLERTRISTRAIWSIRREEDGCFARHTSDYWVSLIQSLPVYYYY